MLPQQANGEAFEPGNIVCRMAVAKPAFVFPERHVETPMQCVFNSPVAADGRGKSLDSEPKRANEYTRITCFHVTLFADVSSGERLYRISGEGLVGWNLLIPANQAIRIRGSVRP
jgi:hypothetical protein